jgi:hypothetical protein
VNLRLEILTPLHQVGITTLETLASTSWNPATYFLASNDFLDRYKTTKGRSATSEPYFQHKIQSLIGIRGTVTRHKDIILQKSKLQGVKKRFDFCLEMDDKITLIELKKNIDVVEKDLFKFLLLSRENLNFRTVLIIWEEKNNWGSGHYPKLLDFGKHMTWIDEWFYIHKDNYEKEFARLKTFLLS